MDSNDQHHVSATCHFFTRATVSTKLQSDQPPPSDAADHLLDGAVEKVERLRISHQHAAAALICQPSLSRQLCACLRSACRQHKVAGQVMKCTQHMLCVVRFPLLLARCKGSHPFYTYTHTAWMVDGLLLYYQQVRVCEV